MNKHADTTEGNKTLTKQKDNKAQKIQRYRTTTRHTNMQTNGDDQAQPNQPNKNGPNWPGRPATREAVRNTQRQKEANKHKIKQAKTGQTKTNQKQTNANKNNDKLTHISADKPKDTNT